MLTTYDDIIGKPATQQNAPDNNQAAPQQAAETTAQAATPQAGVATQVAATPTADTSAAPAETATQQTTQATQAVAQPTQQKTPMSYADMFVAMSPYKPMTPEERAAEAKRNRRNAMFAAISDGISALSNLYFTTKGAPNSFNGGSTLSGKMYERQRQLEKEREAMDKDYINGYIRAMEMDRNRNNAERNYQQQLKQIEYNMQRNAAADKRADEERDEKRRINAHNERYAKARADRAEVDAQTYPSYRQSVIDKNKRTGTGTRTKVTTPKPPKEEEYSVDGKIVRIPVTAMNRKSAIKQAAEAAGLEQKDNETDKNFETRVMKNPNARKKVEELGRQHGSVIGEQSSNNDSGPNYYGGSVIGNRNDNSATNDYSNYKRK